MSDFRDQIVKEALDKSVGRYRPERTRRSRWLRVGALAALALAVFAGFWIVLHHSTPKPGNKAASKKPIAVELLPPAKDR